MTGDLGDGLRARVEQQQDDRDDALAVLRLLRDELASATAHGFAGTSLERFTRHDRRLADGGCCACVVLAIADHQIEGAL